MTIKTANILKISIVSFICIAIGVTVLLLIRKENKNSSDLESGYAALEEELRDLKEERNSISSEINSIDEKLEGRGYEMGSALILYTDTYDYFLDDIYPTLEKNGYAAIISVDASYFISAEGKMTVEELNNLVSVSKYEISMTLNKSTDIEALYNQFNKNNLSSPTVAYYPSNDYTEDNINTLKALGITTIISKNGESKIEDSMFYIRAVGSYSDTTKTEFSSAVSNSIPMAFLIGYTNSDEAYSSTNLSNMVSSFKTYSVEFPVENTLFARTRFIKYLDEKESEKSALESRKAELTVRLNEIKAEIAEKEKEGID